MHFPPAARMEILRWKTPEDMNMLYEAFAQDEDILAQGFREWCDRDGEQPQIGN